MAFRGLGTTLKIGADVSAVTVAELTEISGLELSADTIDVTALDSVGGYREFIAGFKDAGEVGISGFLNPASGKGQKELHALFESGATSQFSIDFPAATKAKWEFSGVVTGFSTSTGVEDPISFEATIKVSGQPTLTVTA